MGNNKRKSNDLSDEAARYIFTKFRNNDAEIVPLWHAINPDEERNKSFFSNYKKCLCLWFEIDSALHGDRNHNNRNISVIDIDSTLNQIDTLLKKLIAVYKNEKNDNLKDECLKALTSLNEYYQRHLAADIQKDVRLKKIGNKIHVSSN